MLFSYGYARHKIDDRQTCTCFAHERITQYGRSRATLNAAGRRHWVDAMVIEFGIKN
jgi:hypothetical protein